MTRQGYLALVAANRHRLITAFNFRCQQSAGHCAAVLTKHAVRQGYVAPRAPIKGATLIDWARQDGTTAPAWACKAALELALADGYVPRIDGEWAACVHFWLSTQEVPDDIEAALDSFAAHLERDRLRPWVEMELAQRHTVRSGAGNP